MVGLNPKYLENSKMKLLHVTKNTLSQFAVVMTSMSLNSKANLQSTGKKSIENGANKVIFVEANKMIEDWFLHDLSGLCRFLKIVKPKNIKGKDGNEKMISLFKKAGKIYQKGTYCYHFLDSLDISIIYEQEKAQLKALEDLLFRKK